ncbi:MAG TPA: hypothetical protein VKM55_01655 [Candidatus Lokiarchaeia archaeon]|nr:hypothetical protein [Candidatus Lokiarchaeia archaeon]
MVDKDEASVKLVESEPDGITPGSAGTGSPMVLSSIQKAVLEIAARLMEKHYVLDIEALHEECLRSMINIDKDVINDAIDDLLSKKYLIHGKAVTRETVLENEIRQRIYIIIKGEPGIHFSRIKGILQKESQTIEWHLMMLVKFNFIRKEKFGINIVYFDFMLENSHDLLYYYLHKDAVPAIFKRLLASPGISFITLMAELNMPRSTLARKLKSLIDQGLLIGTYGANQTLSVRIRDDLVHVLQAIFSTATFN